MVQSQRRDYDGDLGNPGYYALIRGVQRNRYQSRVWTMCQYAARAAAEKNKRCIIPAYRSFRMKTEAILLRRLKLNVERP